MCFDTWTTFKVWRNANLVLHVAERGKPKGNVEFSLLLHSRILIRVKRHLRFDRLKRSECEYAYHKIRANSVGRASVL